MALVFSHGAIFYFKNVGELILQMAKKGSAA
jgi:hypothetical protein